MREAVIVSTARTPIGKAYRGAFNASPPPMLGGHAIKHAVARAGIDGAEVEDVVWGAALQQGAQGFGFVRWNRMIRLVACIESVTGSAGANFSRLKRQPETLAHDRGTIWIV